MRIATMAEIGERIFNPPNIYDFILGGLTSIVGVGLMVGILVLVSACFFAAQRLPNKLALAVNRIGFAASLSGLFFFVVWIFGVLKVHLHNLLSEACSVHCASFWNLFTISISSSFLLGTIYLASFYQFGSKALKISKLRLSAILGISTAVALLLAISLYHLSVSLSDQEIIRSCPC